MRPLDLCMRQLSVTSAFLDLNPKWFELRSEGGDYFHGKCLHRSNVSDVEGIVIEHIITDALQHCQESNIRVACTSGSRYQQILSAVMSNRKHHRLHPVESGVGGKGFCQDIVF